MDFTDTIIFCAAQIKFDTISILFQKFSFKACSKWDAVWSGKCEYDIEDAIEKIPFAMWNLSSIHYFTSVWKFESKVSANHIMLGQIWISTQIKLPLPECETFICMCDKIGFFFSKGPDSSI